MAHLGYVESQQCPDQYTLTPDKKHCVRLHLGLNVMQQYADALCELEDAYLPKITETYMNTFVYNMASKSSAEVWLGIQCTGTIDNNTISCRWQDGSLVIYNNWVKGFPNDYVGQCAYMGVEGNGAGKWISSDCDLTQHSFMCEKDLANSTTRKDMPSKLNKINLKL
ncbi:hypothetical protein WR25_18453 [Diploscapter pachys]|uniref:C-type lectin domain-containing protein n=1 Tax=Diploscapter pachys TaxID=2018661 RepID=A0A2A2K1Z3_9BILA|nr:hypothetical protein WR25_18453 [Diploscapter pachys]